MGGGIPASHLVRSVLSARDRDVIELVGRFGQLSRAHIGAAFFAGLASQTPLDRALKRLVERKYLARISRMVGGDGGGSSQYVYQLGRQGWSLLGRPGRYWPFRSVNLHTLAIADCFVKLLKAERAGWLTLVSFEPEPACHRTVGSVALTPDAHVEVGFRELGLKVSVWLEADRGTEHVDKVRDKCIRYWRAYRQWEADTYPYVLFVVPDAARTRTIEKSLLGAPNEASQLVKCCTFTSFPQVLIDMAKTEVNGIDQQRSKAHNDKYN